MIIKIFQLDEENDRARHFLFMNYTYFKKYLDTDEISNLGILELYKCVYEIDEYSPKTTDTNELSICDDIFVDFNIDRPEDFKGRSLSVSDIIQIDDKFYFVDSFNFVELN